MDLLKLIIEVRLTKPSEKYTFIKDVIDIVAPGKFKEIPPLKEGARFEITEEKFVFVLENNRFAITAEQVTQPDILIPEIKQKLSEVNNHLNWKEISRIGVRTQWKKDVNISFDSLCGRFKKNFYGSNPLVESAEDVGIALVFSDGDSKVNVSSGPMKKEQLGMFLQFKPDSMPAKFFFVDTDYFSTEKADYSDSFFNDYFDKAFNFSERKATEVADVVV